MTEQAQILERGEIYFLYRPRIDENKIGGLEDIQRFYVVLRPQEKDLVRLLVIGRKRLPDVENHKEREWGFVDVVTRHAEDLAKELRQVTYETRRRGRRVQPGTRPAGAGVYSIARHDDHTHLAYALQLPDKPGPVQQQLKIEPEASYILSVRNPDAPAPPGFGPTGARGRPSFPESLRNRFGRRRFVPVDPPDFLDYEGAEILLIGATPDPENELGLDFNREKELRQKEDLLRELRRELVDAPVEPLLQGEWR